MVDNKSSKFGFGLIVGTVLGALAGIFLAPQSGKENREMVLEVVEKLKKNIDKMAIDKKVKEIWGEVSEEGVRVYTQVRKGLLVKLEEFRDKWEEIDKEKYISLVEDAVESAKKNSSTTAEKLAKLKKAFVKDWETIMEEKTRAKK